MGYVLVYPWHVEHSHRSRLELLIPCLSIMVYVGYCLFSSCGILTSSREVLRSLGSGMRRYLDIPEQALKMLVRVPRSCLRPLLECPLCDE